MEPSSFFVPEREAMLRHLIEHGIQSQRVLAAMEKIPREQFVPEDVAHLAYADRAAPIGHEQTISQPYMVALMTQALALTGSERVLEIGTGSGYQTALLAELAAEVFSIERHVELSRGAADALAELAYTNVSLRVGDGTQGWPEHAPFDRILVAAAARATPTALVEQLAEGGILVIPIGDPTGQTLTVLHKQSGNLHAEYLTGCRFVPLVSDGPEPR